jgi:hypothetical protein
MKPMTADERELKVFGWALVWLWIGHLMAAGAKS